MSEKSALKRSLGIFCSKFFLASAAVCGSSDSKITFSRPECFWLKLTKRESVFEFESIAFKIFVSVFGGLKKTISDVMAIAAVKITLNMFKQFVFSITLPAFREVYRRPGISRINNHFFDVAGIVFRCTVYDYARKLAFKLTACCRL